MLKCDDNLSSRNHDMIQNVILRGCDLERLRSSMKAKSFSHRSPPFTDKYACEVSLKSYFQFCRYCRTVIDQRVARRKKKEERGNKRESI